MSENGMLLRLLVFFLNHPIYLPNVGHRKFVIFVYKNDFA